MQFIWDFTIRWLASACWEIHFFDFRSEIFVLLSLVLKHQNKRKHAGRWEEKESIELDRKKKLKLGRNRSFWGSEKERILSGEFTYCDQGPSISFVFQLRKLLFTFYSTRSCFSSSAHHQQHYHLKQIRNCLYVSVSERVVFGTIRVLRNFYYIMTFAYSLPASGLFFFVSVIIIHFVHSIIFAPRMFVPFFFIYSF